MKLTVIGDIMCEPSIMNAGKLSDRNYSFDFVFENAKKIWEKSDYVVGNLEFPLAEEIGASEEIVRFLFQRALQNALDKRGEALTVRGTVAMNNSGQTVCLGDWNIQGGIASYMGVKNFIFGMLSEEGIPVSFHGNDIVATKTREGIDFSTHRENFVGIILMRLSMYNEIKLNLFSIYITIKIHYHGLCATAIETT